MVIYGKARQRKIYKIVQPDERKFEIKVMAESMHGSYELLDEEKKK